MTGSGGIRATLAAWGKFLRVEYNTERVFDPSLHHLGVFTDNGAFYDSNYWPDSSKNPEPNLDANIIFERLSTSYRDRNIPIKYIQLDDWW